MLSSGSYEVAAPLVVFIAAMRTIRALLASGPPPSDDELASSFDGLPPPSSAGGVVPTGRGRSFDVVASEHAAKPRRQVPRNRRPTPVDDVRTARELILRMRVGIGTDDARDGYGARPGHSSW